MGLVLLMGTMGSAEAQVQSGKASFYADYFEGKFTACGEVFKQHELTAAHKSLPFHTLVRVTNLHNGNEVVVRINDRGPFVQGRIIDLSHAAATALDFVRQGITDVRVEIVPVADLGVVTRRSIAGKKLPAMGPVVFEPQQPPLLPRKKPRKKKLRF